jgi:hypothetical protein
LEKEYQRLERDLSALTNTIGTYPALRRSYRKWLEEVIEQDIAVADNIFKTVLVDEALAIHFRDDTLVSLLRSSQSVKSKHN